MFKKERGMCKKETGTLFAELSEMFQGKAAGREVYKIHDRLRTQPWIIYGSSVLAEVAGDVIPCHFLGGVGEHFSWGAVFNKLAHVHERSVVRNSECLLHVVGHN